MHEHYTLRTKPVHCGPSLLAIATFLFTLENSEPGLFHILVITR